MFGSTVLEVATGMVFVFLLVSLICSQVGNKISEALNWRARDLERGIRELLLGGEKDTLLKDLYNTFHVQQFKTVIAPAAEWMLKQPALKNLVFIHNQDPKKPDLGPASLPAQSFALGIVQALVPDDVGVTSLTNFQAAVQAKMQPSPLKEALLAVAQQPFAAVEDIRTQIETMYNHAEDQMTTFYRQHMWQLALTIGLIVSIFLNVDAIAIGFRLWRDPSLRVAVNAAAEKYATEAKPQEARQELDQLNLPIGWQITTGWTIQNIPIPRLTPNDWAQEPHGETILGWLRDILIKILGWLITAAAAAQGAPFWFDLLGRLTQRDNTTSTSKASA
jgi:hypothetical protein